MKKEVIISAKHLKKSFGSGESEQVIYSDFDIDIYKGDFMVIMGASGAGKSTRMYSLSGMDKPNAGTITYGGVKITELSSDELAVFRRKNCGFVFQQIYLIDKMNLMDNVVTAGSLTCKNKTDIVNRANKHTGPRGDSFLRGFLFFMCVISNFNLVILHEMTKLKLTVGKLKIII